MPTELLVAIVGLIGVIITQIATSRATQSKVTSELETQNAVQNTKIDQLSTDIETIKSELTTKIDYNNTLVETKLQHLTDEVRQHNNFAQRVPELEGEIKLLSEKLNVANKRIADLEVSEKEFRKELSIKDKV